MTEETTEMASGRIAIGIDVGGSGIKAAVVDVEAGRLRSERLRVATPNPSTPDAVLASIARLVRRLAKSSGLGDATPVGIGLPGVASTASSRLRPTSTRLDRLRCRRPADPPPQAARLHHQ
jgi:predicted NBD/HSP70 family sugar kinase